MARWVLYCLQCGEELAHDQIYVSAASIRDPYTSVIKPKFPDGGLPMTCPNCGNFSIYQRYQLIYQES
jgi:hypothetical protein